MLRKIANRLTLEVFPFVVGVVTEPIKADASLACHKDLDLGSKLYMATSFRVHNRSDM